MIDFLRNWVTKIVILIILVSLLEIILPTSNMKRYINMVIGLLVIIVLINPFIQLLAEENNLNKEILLGVLEANNVTQNSDEYFSNIRDSQIIQLYKDSLKQEIIDLIHSKTRYRIASISLEIIEESDNDRFGEIVSVSIIIDDIKNDTESSTKKDTNIMVDKIKEVTVKIKNESNTKNKNSTTEYNDLRRLIADTYRIQENNIIIEN